MNRYFQVCLGVIASLGLKVADAQATVPTLLPLPVQPTLASQSSYDTSRSAEANVCLSGICRDVGVTEQYGTDGKFQFSYVSLTENGSDATGYFYRFVFCQYRDKHLLKVLKFSAALGDTALDTSSALCTTFGYKYLWDYTYEDYPFEGTVYVAGDWQSPTVVSTDHSTNHVTNLSDGSSENGVCDSLTANTMLAGAIRINGEFMPFVNPEYSWVYSNYESRDCKTVTH